MSCTDGLLGGYHQGVFFSCISSVVGGEWEGRWDVPVDAGQEEEQPDD